MKQVRARIEIEAAAGDVWRILTNFEDWPTWGPTVRDVRSEATGVAPGVTGQVKTVAGVWLPFEITDVEPGRLWTWKVAGVPATGHYVSEAEDGRTVVEFTVPIVLAPYALVLRAGLKRLSRLAAPTAI